MPPADAPPAFQAFSKYDFVSGELVLALDDFTRTRWMIFAPGGSENADVKVVIVGHKRRAASVKTALATEFKIGAGRMDTDGEGESEPVDKNDTGGQSQQSPGRVH